MVVPFVSKDKLVSAARGCEMASMNMASFFVPSFGRGLMLSPSRCSEKQLVLCFNGSGNITNRPSPTRRRSAALRGSVRGRAARLKRYIAVKERGLMALPYCRVE